MSTSAGEGPRAVVKEKKGLGKYISRIKTVLRRKDGSKGTSRIEDIPVVASSSLPAESTPLAESSPPAVEESDDRGGPRTMKMMRSEIMATRARKLGERFALEIEPFPMEQDREVTRVEKAIRMRIHRTCHKCHTSFGASTVCTECGHVRCKGCPRHPGKNASGKGKEPEADVASGKAHIEPESNWRGLQDELLLTKPNPRTGGQPLVRKKPKQRVRRTCHNCSTLFGPGVRICPSCEHVRCADCPRDPAKRSKYPDGYPGDAPSSDISRPVKYSCHECRTVFPPVPHPSSPEGLALKESQAPPLICEGCQHPRCYECPRAPPTRIEPAPDPEVLMRVQAKLEALDIAGASNPAS